MVQATRDFTVKTVQKAADIAVKTGSRLYTDSASSYRGFKGYAHDFVNHTKKEYAWRDSSSSWQLGYSLGPRGLCLWDVLGR